MIAALLLLLQAEATAAAPSRFSILVEPCASASAEGRDVVVCGRRDSIAPRLPLRDQRGSPDKPVPSNPEMSGTVALNGPAGGLQECGYYGEGCPVGGGGYLLPKLIDGAAGAVRSAFARKPDRRGRVAIDLEAPPPPIPADAVRP